MKGFFLLFCFACRKAYWPSKNYGDKCPKCQEPLILIHIEVFPPELIGIRRDYHTLDETF